VSEEKVLEILIDLCTALEAAAIDAKHRIAELTSAKEPQAVREETFDILKFEPQTGSRLGQFEIAAKAKNLEDKFNHAFQILRQANAVIADPYHGPNYKHNYWTYQDAIYRKVRKEKGPESKTEVDVIAQIEAKFPTELKEILTFEAIGEYIVIKPRQYLGSENFAKIASIVRGEGGEYLSAGKESHFRIKKRR